MADNRNNAEATQDKCVSKGVRVGGGEGDVGGGRASERLESQVDERRSNRIPQKEAARERRETETSSPLARTVNQRTGPQHL